MVGNWARVAREEHLAALVALRGLGRREALKKLEMLKADVKKLRRRNQGCGYAKAASEGCWKNNV